MEHTNATTAERLIQISNKHKRMLCNICGCPREVTYEETDKEGKRSIARHVVECGGHQGIHPSMWNKHPDYDKYAMLAAHQHVNAGAPEKK